VLYLIFNQGYAGTIGPDLQRSDLANEAVRLTGRSATFATIGKWWDCLR
jgi:predicted RNA polymerase sigma factor